MEIVLCIRSDIFASQPQARLTSSLYLPRPRLLPLPGLERSEAANEMRLVGLGLVLRGGEDALCTKSLGN